MNELVAQLVEQRPFKAWVLGSSPSELTTPSGRDTPIQTFASALCTRRPGGFLQFSIIHPCFSPPHRRVLRNADAKEQAIEIGRYFDCIDGQLNSWWFSTLPAGERTRVEPFRTPMFHRTLSGWVEIICGAGLAIEKFAEPCATPELAAEEPVVADTRVAPLFLHIRARKITAS